MAHLRIFFTKTQLIMKINPKNVKKATQLDHSINPTPELEANSQSNRSQTSTSQRVNHRPIQQAPIGLISIPSDSPSVKLFATPVGFFEFSRVPYSTQPSNPIQLHYPKKHFPIHFLLFYFSSIFFSALFCYFGYCSRTLHADICNS